MQRIRWLAWLTLFLLAACSKPDAPMPAQVPASVSNGLPALTVYKSPT